MSENEKNSGQVDRRQNSSGIKDGGRRKADQPASTASKKWFIASMLLTCGIMGWTFTIPFRSGSGSPLLTWQSGDSGQPGDADTQYRSEEIAKYVDELKLIEDDFQNELRAKQERRYKAPSKEQLNKKLKGFRQKMYEESKELLELTENKPVEGTVEWERLNELKSISEDLKVSEESN